MRITLPTVLGLILASRRGGPRSMGWAGCGSSNCPAPDSAVTPLRFSRTVDR